MKFNDNSKLAGQHAFLSASKHSWLNYPEDKFDRVFLSNMAAQRGTRLHKLANDMIELGVRARDEPTTMNLYVNDAIGFRMKPELTLFYSLNCFGTPDTISFRNNKLRIRDLKTGTNHTSEKQLEIYAALFCLEYKIKPFDIEIELRIYQNDDIRIYQADPVDIALIMDKIVDFDRRINLLREEVG